MNHYPPYEPKDIVPVPNEIAIDDTIFKAYTWEVPPNSEVPWKGRIVYVHGYRDTHKPYCRHFEYLAKNGYDVFFYYQYGEGETKQKDGSRAVSNDYHAYKGVDDMIQYNVNLLKESNKPLNLHLMGHSMGGGIVLNYCINGKRRELMKSFSTIAPLVTLHKNTDPGLFLELVVRTLCLTKFGQNLRVSTHLNHHYLTSDDNVAQYIQDNVDIENASGAFVETRDFILRGKHLLKEEIYSKIGKTTPLLICHGDDDSINDCEGSKSFIEKVNSIEGMKNKEIIIYKTGRHCLHCEKEDIAYTLATDMLAFLNKYN